LWRTDRAIWQAVDLVALAISITFQLDALAVFSDVLTLLC